MRGRRQWEDMTQSLQELADKLTLPGPVYLKLNRDRQFVKEPVSGFEWPLFFTGAPTCPITSLISLISRCCRRNHNDIFAGPGGQIRIHPHRTGSGWRRGPPPEDRHCYGECMKEQVPSP